MGRLGKDASLGESKLWSEISFTMIKNERFVSHPACNRGVGLIHNLSNIVGYQRQDIFVKMFSNRTQRKNLVSCLSQG